MGIALHHRQHVVHVSSAAQRGEDLAARHAIAALGGHRHGAEARSGTRRLALGERLGMDDAAADHSLPQVRPGFGEMSGHGPVWIQLAPALAGQQCLGDRAGEQRSGGVHVERQRRGGAMPTHLLGHERVAHEVGTQPAGLGGHAQAQEPGIGQVGPVLVREAGIAVVLGCALGKRRPQLGHPGHELGSLGRQHLFIHHSHHSCRKSRSRHCRSACRSRRRQACGSPSRHPRPPPPGHSRPAQ